MTRPNLLRLSLVGAVVLLGALLARELYFRADGGPTRVEVNLWMRGMFSPTTPNSLAPLKELEREIGVTFDGLKWYQDWYTPWSSSIPNTYHTNGYIPEMTWQPQIKDGTGHVTPIPYNTIVAGQHDAYIDQMAGQVKALPYRLRIALGPEFNGNWNPWGIGVNGNTAENHKAAWRHTVNRFRELRVINVDWIWAPNIDPENFFPPYASLYPGDEYVTYFGLDGYNFGKVLPTGTWRSFRQLYQSSYDQLVAINPHKAIYIMEIGSVEQGGNKAQWIKEMFEDLEQRYPNIRGLTWFHVDFTPHDFRITTSEGAKRQFALSVNGTPPPPSANNPSSGSSPPPSPPASPSEDKGLGQPQQKPATTAQTRPEPPSTSASPSLVLPSVLSKLAPNQASAVVAGGLLLLFLLTALVFALVRRTSRP